MRGKLYKLTLLAMAAALIAGSWLAQRHMNRFREESGLTRLTILENAPPVLAFTTVALGAFRGLIANALWVRVADLQEQGKYFEMVQLSDWITKLQPHLDQVWVHLAWNMSYNISVKFQSPADRWMWVQRGIELLRDEALKYNPNEPNLYRELAWHFQHKLGQNLDDAHVYYKARWAQQMDEVLGGGHPDWDRLIHPQTEADRKAARTLREKYKLDPAFMKKVDEKYGPLEWRLPDAHAIYWAMKGLEEVRRRYQNDPAGLAIMKDKQFITLRRVIYQSLQQAFRRGRLIRLADQDRFEFGPNIDMADNVNAAFQDMMAAESEKWREHMRTGYKNFLRDASYFLYTNNRIAEAQKWFRMLKEKFPGDVPADMSLDEYAVERVTEIVSGTGRDRTLLVLQGLLAKSYYNLAIGQEDQAVSYERLARLVHTRYMREISVIEEESQRKRVGLPPFQEIKKEVLDYMLAPNSPELSPYLQNTLRTQLGLPAPETESPAPGTEESGPREESRQEGTGAGETGSGTIERSSAP